MPFNSNNGGGPWGGGGRGDRGKSPWGGGGGGGNNQGPDLDELIRKGRDQLRVVLGGRRGGPGG
ncbi:MAG TPA: protease modulator HflK N-terminal domain-containing protein, partial [Paracoccaceae bacterium]|nr:protease modulator HflK N-terminal domain-containing protein [Paracoccaceae bacterium]